jgi:hypothetical protein
VTRRALLGDGPPTIASVGARTSDRISEPLRGIAYSLSLGAAVVRSNKKPQVVLRFALS